MARTVATLPEGSRITDYISLGVVAKTFPLSKIRSVLAATGKSSVRERDLPAHVVVYYVIALSLFMQSSYREVLRCLLEGVQWLLDPSVPIKVAGKSGISQARSRLGWEPVRQLHDDVVKPIAIRSTRGAWYRDWRLVSLDGSTLDVADEMENDEAFGRPGASRGDSAYPQIRFVSLIENRCDEPVDRLSIGNAVQAIVDDADLDAVGLAPPILPGWVDVAQVGTIGELLVSRQAHVLLDPPEQIGAGRSGQIPQLEAEELSVCQAQHARPQACHNGFGQRDLSRMVVRHLAAEQHVRAILDQ